MTPGAHVPPHLSRLDRQETFTFSCHREVRCFTDCCRMLELALTPYDVLRLRKATRLTSGQLLESHIIIEQDAGEPFPRFYLTMVDDGRASCVFVTKQGCSVYGHRPGACRAYPLGRAVIRQENGTMEELFVLMREDHCKGFQEPISQNSLHYCRDQELLPYNRFNDAVAAILQHDSIRKGFVPSAKQIDLFVLALYNIDSFRELAQNDQLDAVALTPAEKNCLVQDEELLLFAVDWLSRQLFAPF